MFEGVGEDGIEFCCKCIGRKGSSDATAVRFTSLLLPQALGQ